MLWFAPLLVLISAAIPFPAQAQLTPGGPSGDFRVEDRPGTVPSVGPHGGPSPVPGSTMFRDNLAPMPPDEVLKSIDKDLGRSTLQRPGLSGPSFEMEKELRSPADKLK